MKIYSGHCHCGAVQFEVDTDLDGPFRCNCSLCARRGTIIQIVPATRFRVISGEDMLTKYGNRDFSKHFFCRTCGIQCFTRLTVNMKLENEPSVGVNVGCLEGVDLGVLEPGVFDGAHAL